MCSTKKKTGYGRGAYYSVNATDACCWAVEHREASNQNNTHNRPPRSGSPHDVMHLSSNYYSVLLAREGNYFVGRVLLTCQKLLALQGMSSLRSLIPFRLSHLPEISAHA